MTPEESTKIREEEQLRHDVRKELADKDRTIWHLLNSGFVLWILSSVLLAGFISFYSSLRETTESRSINAHRASEFDSELRRRLRFFAERIRTLDAEMTLERNSVATALDPSGWYAAVNQRWVEAQQPEFSPKQELRFMPIDQLLSSLSEAIVASGARNPELVKNIDAARIDWVGITKDCYEEYKTFKPSDLKPDGYYAALAGVLERTSARLSIGPLKNWASPSSVP